MKYSLTENFKVLPNGIILFQIKAERDIKRFGVKKGDLGGWLQEESNLSQEGDSWVGENAHVSECAVILGNAWVHGNAVIYGYAKIYGDAEIEKNLCIHGDARVFGSAQAAL